MAGVSNHRSEIVKLVVEAEQSSYIGDSLEKALDESCCISFGSQLGGVIEAGENPRILGSKIKNPSSRTILR